MNNQTNHQKEWSIYLQQHSAFSPNKLSSQEMAFQLKVCLTQASFMMDEHCYYAVNLTQGLIAASATAVDAV